jgi:hypothetical protein
MKVDLDYLQEWCFFEGTAEDSEAVDFITKMLQTDSASELIAMSKSALKKAAKEDVWKDVAWLFLQNESTPDSVLSDLVQIAPEIQATIMGGEEFEYVKLIAHPNNSPSSLNRLAKAIGNIGMPQSPPLTALYASTKLDSESLAMLCEVCGVEKMIDAFLVLSHPNITDISKGAASWFEGTAADLDAEELAEHDFLIKYTFDIPVELKKRLKKELKKWLSELPED